MRALVLTSNKLRHKFFIQTIKHNFDLVGAIYEDKGSYYKEQQKDSTIVSNHFKQLEQTEKDFFGDLDNLDYLNYLNIEKNNINNDEVIKWAKELNPDVIFLFGTGILKSVWLNGFKDRIINLHLGLSPFYKGSATLFWPFVNDELCCIGATIHLAVEKVDSGSILARVKPNIDISDNYYTVNYKTIKKAILLLPEIAKSFIENKSVVISQDNINSRIYKKIDFNEEVLNYVIEKYGQSIPKKEYELLQKGEKCNY